MSYDEMCEVGGQIAKVPFRVRRPAVKKFGTVATKREILKERKLTIGLDLGDRSSHYCILDEVGNVILEHNVPTTPKGIHRAFRKIARSRIELEIGTDSRLRWD
jgi:transposase